MKKPVTKNIICFDENKYFKKQFKKILLEELKDIHIVSAFSQNFLLKELQANEYHFIILDIFSFKEDVLNTIRKIREIAKDKKIFMMDAYSYGMLDKYCKKAGADNCFDKNDEKELLRMLALIKDNLNKNQ